MYGGGLKRGGVDEGFDGDGLVGVICGDVFEYLIWGEWRAILVERSTV